MPTNPTLATKDPSILITRIKKAFPELMWQTFKFIDVGWDHEVIQLDDKYIFRFPNSIEYSSALKDEVELLAYLSLLIQAPTPEYAYVADDVSFAGYNMLSGQALSLEAFEALDQSERGVVAKDIASFLSDLHSIKLEELSRFNIGTEKPFGGYDDVTDLARTHIKPNLSADKYTAIDGMLKDIVKAQVYPQPERLTHGDIAPKHLLWDGATISFIDFSDRSISDPAIDFAELYAYGEAFVNKVYELYSGVDKNADFLDRAKAYMKAIGVRSLANAFRTDRITVDEAMKLIDLGLPLTLND